MEAALVGQMITGMVSALSAYMTYRVGMRQAEEQGKATSTKPEEVKKGESLAPVIEAAIQKYGRDDEQTALTGYRQNPKLFEAPLIQVLTDIALRSPEFAVDLKALAEREGFYKTGGQTAIGNNIAQADRGSTASVNINDAGPPKKV
ncbi:hypothetical protein [Kouleothrix sp.]|uniref:hypothetical protein n=1 Tax=Kouleothrix sp. TaxID=2779161 RepID=UPI00391DE076